MEEAPTLSQKFTKSETTQRQNHQRRSYPRGGASNNTKQNCPDPPAAGQVAFRMLCRVNTAGGVIGSSGSIIKHLETLTGSKIRFEDGLRNCVERVINIVGDAAIEKKILIGESGDEDSVEVSKAQEGLMSVFERVLEVERNGMSNEKGNNNEHHNNGFIGCRLLVPMGQIGAVMGKGGKIVDGIRKSSGAKIRVLKKEQIPACAAPEEELIQIMGGAVAVKKALLAVSRRLQDRTFGEGAPGHMSSRGGSHNFPADFTPNFTPNNCVNLSSQSGSPAVHHSVGHGHSLSADVKRTLNLDEDNSQIKVVFRFLCSNGIAGGVIGKGANIVKSLEKETGASIKFASPASGSKERLAIISSLENPDPLYSPAQIAIIRVFARCIEVGLDQGVISSLGNRERVTARILIASNQVDCLLNEDRSIASDISMASGVEITLKGVDLLAEYAGDSDNVVQIVGKYENVKSALFQVTGRLRENFFSGKGAKGTDFSLCSYSSTPSSSPIGREAASSPRLAQLSRLSCIDQLDHLGFVDKTSSPCSPGLQWEQQANSIRSAPRTDDSGQSLTTFSSGSEQESKVGNEVPMQAVEVFVPGKAFGLVYGENGRNLVRLKEISGASVIMKDPCPGESDGKVIISGMPEQIQIAQSLLQAFLLN